MMVVTLLALPLILLIKTKATATPPPADPAYRAH